MTHQDTTHAYDGLAQAADPLLTELLAVSPSLAQLHWHLNRYDELRASVASRAAMILNAIAFVLAGSTFLLDKTLSHRDQFSPSTKYILFGSIIILLGSLVISVLYAIRAIVSMRSTRILFDGKLPPRIFFNSRDTISRFRNYSEFRTTYLQTTSTLTTEYALSELFSGIYQYRYRYRNLRIAIWSLFVSIVLFLVAMLTYILGVITA